MFWITSGFRSDDCLGTFSNRIGGWLSCNGILLAEYFLGGWSCQNNPTRPLEQSVRSSPTKVSGGKTN